MNIRCVGYGSVYSKDCKFFSEPEKGVYFLIFARNRARFYINNEWVKTPENTLVIYNDTSACGYASDNNFLICDWICFDTDGDTEFIESLEFEYNKPFRFGESQFLIGMISSISAEYYSAKARRIKTIDVFMKTLLLKASEEFDSREYVQQTSKSHYSELNDLREKIYRNPQIKWNVDSMAMSVNMSRSYFQHIYKEVFGVSCMTDVINGKIEKAKEILTETSCTVSQVATMCGYDNEEHFLRQFKKIVGKTPTSYRKEI